MRTAARGLSTLLFIIALIAFPLGLGMLYSSMQSRYDWPVEGAVTIATAPVTMWLTSMGWVFIEYVEGQLSVIAVTLPCTASHSFPVGHD